MADRVSARITIGGTLPSTLLPEFIALIEQQGLSTEWDGEPFTVHDLPESGGLNLMAHEVAWGRFEALEAFCVKNALPFSRWSVVEGRHVTPFNLASGAPNGLSFRAAVTLYLMLPTRMTIS